MSFLDTEPAALHRPESAVSWARFRIGDPRRVWATLRELCRGAVPLSIGTAGGANAIAVLWAVDEERGLLHLSATPTDKAFDALMATPQLWAAGYLQDTKIQFELGGLRLHAERGAVAARPFGDAVAPATLQAQAPSSIYQLPRRQAMRVKRADELAPMVSFRHPLYGERTVTLRVLDISLSGAGLFRPTGSLPLAPGVAISRVEVQLDEDHIFVTDMRVQHVTFSAASRNGARVGCAWQELNRHGEETLARWIGRGRRRRELISLSFD